jgi:phosphatidylglycerol:prolipoprotein diacylglycerol transferase
MKTAAGGPRTHLMYPEIDIGPITLQTFGICFGIGFIVAGALVGRRLLEWKKPPDWAYEVAFAALIGGLVGARLYYVIDNIGDESVVDSLFSGAGLTWFGGAIGGALAVVAWAYWRGMLSLRLLDMTAAPLAIGYAIGRVGCQLSGDGDYGQAWDGPWAMAYPEGTVSIDETVHPTPIYETLAMGTVAILLWGWRDRFRPGVLFAVYLFLAGLERFMVEFIRRNDPIALGLTQAQWLSVGMILVGAAWFISKREAPPGAKQPVPA